MSETKKPSRSLAGIAGIVAAATLLSKVMGLFRQQAIAAAFGVGAAAGAYNFAYVIPGFLLILLGGINGPFHSAVVSVLAKRRKEEIAPIVETITTLVVGLLLLLTIALVIFADPLMSLVAPGLYISPEQAAARGISPEEWQKLLQTKEIAILQFRIMAPMAMLAGLIGIGFGTLNAADNYLLPSISPLFSSVTVLIGLGVLVWQLGEDITAPQYALWGGAVLAWSTLAGAILQWLVQLPAQWKAGMGGLRPRFNFWQPDVQAVIKIMGPATFSSGMMQINVWTDLFFASFIPQAAAAVSAMGYASLLVNTPLGILSNVILVPLLPIFAKLADAGDWSALKQRIRQGLLLTAVTMLPLSALLVALSVPVVRVIYERYAFDLAASQLTASVLIAYSFGMFFFLGRDVIVRVFYAMGDGDTPFRISLVNIFINALLDFLLVGPFGAPGLVLATVGVNLISMVWLSIILNRRLNGLPWRQWGRPLLGLTGASIFAGVICWMTRWGLESTLGTHGFFLQLLQLAIAGSVGLGIFALMAAQMHLPEVNQFAQRLKQRFKRG